MQRRRFLRIAGGGVVVAATAGGLVACSSALPPEAIAAWQGPGNEPDPRRWVLAHAILAPHSHNLQSWLVDLREPEAITLFIDRSRLLSETDPFSRQMMMSQGTFLELLDLAARQRGLRAEIALFPQGAFGPQALDARPTAHIRLLPDASLRPDPLFAQIFRRHTNREAYEAREPDSAALQAIAASLAPHAVRAGFVGAAQAEALAQHRRIAMEAWRIELETPRTMLESLRVLRIGPKEIAEHRDGLSINDPLVRALTAVGLFDRSRAPQPGDAAITRQIEDFNAKIAATPAFFWMVTEGNDRATQVNAGRAYARAQLAATAAGLSMHPLQQALQEYPEQAGPYADIHRLLEAPSPGHTVQMWVRLGYAPAVGPAPRRGLDAHILPG
ncbi:twiN-arginine translocation pathway signal sequence domain-containing protein [Hydrogenophaga taeniospiralis CCUG 15921]|uniref:TwiN-arginine translocation pathway signal sequence domain-containing protein n=1 Tax=Hydrogenophaga taeniospiralis CCUG 15921 TaxID=1281780 RepID=A0A9X4NXA4_9BURK|nr:nitroreductase family protein [Hydrogenophaga taeniospiralis]MDG5978051.1 twiN-arginine translocation pathway signal sequence domain-containing protein [Hydrogenophaga taeniospiralis CCUG 15921]